MLRRDRKCPFHRLACRAMKDFGAADRDVPDMAVGKNGKTHSDRSLHAPAFGNARVTFVPVDPLSYRGEKTVFL